MFQQAGAPVVPVHRRRRTPEINVNRRRPARAGHRRRSRHAPRVAPKNLNLNRQTARRHAAMTQLRHFAKIHLRRNHVLAHPQKLRHREPKRPAFPHHRPHRRVRHPVHRRQNQPRNPRHNPRRPPALNFHFNETFHTTIVPRRRSQKSEARRKCGIDSPPPLAGEGVGGGGLLTSDF